MWWATLRSARCRNFVVSTTDPTDVTLDDPRFDALVQIAAAATVAAAAPVVSSARTALAGLPATLVPAALAARPAGRWSGFTAADDISALEGYVRGVAGFGAVIASLREADFAAAVPTYATVRDLVAHLVGIEHYVGAQIGLWAGESAERDASHLAVAAAAIERLRGRPPAAVVTAWRHAADAVVVQLRRQPHRLDDPGSWHGAPLDVRSLLVVRTFELWTHADDVRVALGRSREQPTNGQLKLMTDLAAAILPLGLALTGATFPDRTVRLVLTGAGGGTWRRPLHPHSPIGDHDDLLIVVDAVGFCRLAANRCRPADLDAYIEGDAAMARAIFAGMVALAAD